MARAPRRPKFKSSPTEIEIDAVTLAWHLPWARRDGANALILLDRLAAAMPETLPRRFGEFEPFDQRMDREGPEGFRTLWEAQARGEGLQMFFFSATAPCFGGLIGFSDETPQERTGTKMVSVSLDFDGRAMADPFWREAVVTVFQDVARALGAFHAIAFLEPGRTTRLNRLWARADAPQYPVPQEDRWLGVPHVPGWLAWLGGPYAGLMPGAVQSADNGAAGQFLRTSEAPLPLEQIKARPPPLPEELLFNPRTGVAATFPPID